MRGMQTRKQLDSGREARARAARLFAAAMEVGCEVRGCGVVFLLPNDVVKLRSGAVQREANLTG